jgi:hypothetical protein
MASPGTIPAVCDIPLPGGLRTSSSPSVIVFTTTVGFYYLNALWNSGESAAKNSWFAAVMFIIFLSIQVWVIYYQAVHFNKCPPTVWLGILFALIFGAVFGTVTYWVSVAANQNSLTVNRQGFTNYKEKFTDQSAFNSIAFPGGSNSNLASAVSSIGTAAGTLSSVTNAKNTAGVTGQCLQKTANSDEYICDVYKNGQLVTQTITE